jgi:predicted RNA-binding Zn-ribbon protein involved in translation (DUF1610 family)
MTKNVKALLPKILKRLKTKPLIGAVLKEYGVSTNAISHLGIRLSRSPEYLAGRQALKDKLTCKKCGASLKNNRFETYFLCVSCGERWWYKYLVERIRRKRLEDPSFNKKHTEYQKNYQKKYRKDKKKRKA